MAWIKQIPIEAATGLLKTEFEKAIKRAGRVWNIVHMIGDFNDLTRIADPLGVEPETFILPREENEETHAH